MRVDGRRAGVVAVRLFHGREPAAPGAGRAWEPGARHRSVRRCRLVVDVVGGPSWPGLLEVLRHGGRLATSGAIGGPIVELDLRTLYLKDISLIGCTRQEDVVFENLIGYVERGEIEPVIAGTYPLEEIVRAQVAFMAKSFTGKLVLVVV